MHRGQIAAACSYDARQAWSAESRSIIADQPCSVDQNFKIAPACRYEIAATRSNDARAKFDLYIATARSDERRCLRAKGAAVGRNKITAARSNDIPGSCGNKTCGLRKSQISATSGNDTVCYFGDVVELAAAKHLLYSRQVFLEVCRKQRPGHDRDGAKRRLFAVSTARPLSVRRCTTVKRLDDGT